MDKDTIQHLINRINKFRHERDWDQFHTPKNLILAINGESGELAAKVQWLNNANIFMDRDLRFSELPAEMADIFIYLLNLAEVLEVDLIEAANNKIDDNERRYPVDIFKGIAEKSDIK